MCSKPYKNTGLVNIRTHEGFRRVEASTCKIIEIHWKYVYYLHVACISVCFALGNFPSFPQ